MLPSLPEPESESELAGLCRELLRAQRYELGRAERGLLRGAAAAPARLVQQTRDAIERGEDPLGRLLTRLRSPRERRALGATYTPPVVVSAMARSVARTAPARVVDPGAGSGRFLVAAGHLLPDAELVAVEVDPLAALVCRAHLVAAGLGARSRVVTSDYLACELPAIGGRTLFLGNPPYVRHHGLSPNTKDWLVRAANRLGLPASRLAGLHVYFALKTAELARPGDGGALLLSAEWLDVNYGRTLRELFAGALGGTELHVLSPQAKPFDDADTTAVVMRFEVGSRSPSLRVRHVRTTNALGELGGGRSVSRERALATRRWSLLTQTPPTRPAGYVELGELTRVHRGQVTGNNRVWIAGSHSQMLPPELTRATVTRAVELFSASGRLSSVDTLRRVIDLPVDLDELAPGVRKQVERFLGVARALGADRGFIARHRRAWWAVGLREPAPILATYMARRPPAFVRNEAGARHINVVHGLYPRGALSSSALDALADYLSRATSASQGRTYAGGLTKFEPKEMERLWVPGPELLAVRSSAPR